MLILRIYLATGFKTYKKSLIDATVSMFRSQCLVLNGVREGKGKLWSSWYKPCGMWQCFNW